MLIRLTLKITMKFLQKIVKLTHLLKFLIKPTFAIPFVFCLYYTWLIILQQVYLDELKLEIKSNIENITNQSRNNMIYHNNNMIPLANDSKALEIKNYKMRIKALEHKLDVNNRLHLTTQKTDFDHDEFDVETKITESSKIVQEETTKLEVTKPLISKFQTWGPGNKHLLQRKPSGYKKSNLTMADKLTELHKYIAQIRTEQQLNFDKGKTPIQRIPATRFIPKVPILTLEKQLKDKSMTDHNIPGLAQGRSYLREFEKMRATIQNEDESPIIILDWFYNSNKKTLPKVFYQMEKEFCGGCYYTNDQIFEHTADAIIIETNLYGARFEKGPSTKKRIKNQYWASWFRESAAKGFYSAKNFTLIDKDGNGPYDFAFNLTISTRQDSDVPLNWNTDEVLQSVNYIDSLFPHGARNRRKNPLFQTPFFV